MKRYIARRAIRGLLVIWLVSTAVFLGLRLIGDPAEMILAQNASAEDVQRMREFLQLDTPLHAQYTRFLALAIRGDLGDSFRYRRPVLPLILERLPATFEVTLVGLSIAVAVGSMLAIIASLRPNSLVDQLAGFLALIGQSVPVFWLGIMLMMFFAVHLRWLPATGRGGIRNLILPSLCLSTYTLASVFRLLRANMMDVLYQDYICVARSKGLNENTVIVRHALKNAVLPVITVVGLQVSSLLGGAVVVETIFDWPGIGSFILGAILARDFPMVQAGTIVFAVVVVTCNFLVDILYAYVDPRIGYE